MSNVIEFLRRPGDDAVLRPNPRTNIEPALAAAGMDPALHMALLAADQRTLATLLGAETNVRCMMAPGKKEDEDDEDFEDDEDEDEDEDEDDDEDEDEDEDEDDEDEDDEDFDDDEEEENSLTPRRSPVRSAG